MHGLLRRPPIPRCLYISDHQMTTSTSYEEMIPLTRPHKSTPQSRTFIPMSTLPPRQLGISSSKPKSCISRQISRPRTGTHQTDAYETFSSRVKNVGCLIRIACTNRWIHKIRSRQKREYIFILIARHVQGLILHHLLLIAMKDQRDIAERATVLQVPV